MKVRKLNLLILLSVFVCTAPTVVQAAGGGQGGGQGAGKKAKGAAVVSVVTRKVDQHSISQSLSLVGKLEAQDSVVISPEVSGKIEAIKVSANQKVKAGQLLLQLDDDKVKASLSEAKAYLRDEQRKLKEYRRLAKKGAITSTEVEAQQASVDIAKARLDSQNASLSDLNITAPFSGTIGLVDFSQGKMVSTGESLLTLDDLAVMQLDLNVPERYLSMLRKGMDVTATTSAWEDKIFHGELVAVDSRINSDTLTLRARIKFPNQEEYLKPGMLMSATIKFPSITAPIIPAQALEYSGTKRFVYVVDESNKAKRTQVFLGGTCG